MPKPLSAKFFDTKCGLQPGLEHHFEILGHLWESARKECPSCASHTPLLLVAIRLGAHGILERLAQDQQLLGWEARSRQEAVGLNCSPDGVVANLGRETST